MLFPNDVLIVGGRSKIYFWDLKLVNSSVDSNISHKSDACIRTLYQKGKCLSIVLLNNEEIACGGSTSINIFKIRGSLRPLRRLQGHTSVVRDLLLHTDKQRLLSTSNDKTMRIWNIQEGICIRCFESNKYIYKMVWFREDVVATGYGNGAIKLWNVDTGKCLRHLRNDGFPQFGLVIDEKGVFMSFGKGGTISQWSN